MYEYKQQPEKIKKLTIERNISVISNIIIVIILFMDNAITNIIPNAIWLVILFFFHAIFIYHTIDIRRLSGNIESVDDLNFEIVKAKTLRQKYKRSKKHITFITKDSNYIHTVIKDSDMLYGNIELDTIYEIHMLRDRLNINNHKNGPSNWQEVSTDIYRIFEI